MNKGSIVLLCGIAISPLYLGGCTATNQTKGTAVGAGVGGVLGAVIGERSDHRDRGAIIGAVVGGALGNIIGKRMDNQARELEQVPGVEDVTYDQQSQKINTETLMWIKPLLNRLKLPSWTNSRQYLRNILKISLFLKDIQMVMVLNCTIKNCQNGVPKLSRPIYGRKVWILRA